TPSCRVRMYLNSGWSTRTSISGSSVVPGLPMMYSTPAACRISKKACRPAIRGMAYLLDYSPKRLHPAAQAKRGVLQVSEAQSNSTKHLLPQVRGSGAGSTKGQGLQSLRAPDPDVAVTLCGFEPGAEGRAHVARGIHPSTAA